MLRLRLLLLAFGLFHGALYALLMPPWQSPDEVAHYVYARLMFDLRRIPVGERASPELEWELLVSLERHRAWAYRYSSAAPQPLPNNLELTGYHYRHMLGRASFGYWPYALAVWPVRDASVETQMYVMRLASVVLGALIGLLTFELGRVVWPARPALALAGAAVVLLLPQHAFISASVNDGNTATLTTTLVIFLLAWMMRWGMAWRPALAVVGLTVYAVFSKATAYFIVPVVLVTGPLLVWRQWKGRWSHAIVLRLAAAVAVTVVLAAVFVPVVRAAPRLGFIRETIERGLGAWDNAGVHLQTLLQEGQLSVAVWNTFRSFWGSFGWVVLWLPEAWYLALLATTGLALAGLLVLLVSRRPEAAQARPVLVVLAAAALSAIGVILGWFLFSPDGLIYFQGRYIFGAVAAIAVLLVAGWQASLALRRAPALIIVGLCVLDAAALFGVALPYYYRW